MRQLCCAIGRVLPRVLRVHIGHFGGTIGLRRPNRVLLSQSHATGIELLRVGDAALTCAKLRMEILLGLGE